MTLKCVCPYFDVEQNKPVSLGEVFVTNEARAKVLIDKGIVVETAEYPAEVVIPVSDTEKRARKTAKK